MGISFQDLTAYELAMRCVASPLHENFVKDRDYGGTFRPGQTLPHAASAVAGTSPSQPAAAAAAGADSSPAPTALARTESENVALSLVSKTVKATASLFRAALRHVDKLVRALDHT
jgi:hypothetical protein